MSKRRQLSLWNIVVGIIGYAFVVGFFLIVARGGIHNGLEAWYQRRYLRQEGVLEEAIILDIDSGLFDGRGVLYSFEVEMSDGHTITYNNWGRIGFFQRAQLTSGETIPILYDPSNPSFSRLRNDYEFLDVLLAVPAMCGLLAPMVFIIELVLLPRSKLRKRKPPSS
jgi:hypothetical protein